MSEVIHPVERFKVSKLTKHPNNPRILRDAQYQILKKSIEDNPDLLEARPLILSNRTGKNIVIGGNQRLQVVKDLGWLTVPCVLFPDLTEEKEREIMIRDNVSNGDWDFDKLKADWDSTELNEWGLDVPWGDAEPDQVVGQTDADETPEVQPVPVSMTGDMWVLGDHRLLCGDSTDADQVSKLMNGEKADMVFTDPPYNIASENKGVAANVSKAHNDLMNSEWDKGFDFEKVQERLFESISNNVTVYVCTSHHLAGKIWEWMKEWSDHSNWCVWSKPNPMPSLMKRHWTWSGELICYGTRGKHIFNFPNDGHAFSVWNISKVNGSSGHPTEKPVSVPEHAIIHSSNKGQLVLDLFGGSGSTMIACEKTGRHCRMMELDQNYCDVIIRRWQDFTGRQAILESTGQTFEEVKNERIS